MTQNEDQVNTAAIVSNVVHNSTAINVEPLSTVSHINFHTEGQNILGSFVKL